MMKNKKAFQGFSLFVWFLFLLLDAGFEALDTQADGKEEEKMMAEAAPGRARAFPKKPRRLLVFSRSWGYRHTAIPYGQAAVEVLAKKTGAFEAVLSDDASAFEKESLERFDAVLFNNTNNEIFLPENYEVLPPDEKKRAEEIDARLKENLVEFLRGGKGLAVIHAGVASFRNWPEFGEIMGARFDNHPWNAGSRVTLKVDDPEHPVALAFVGDPHPVISDEIYQLKGDYSRETVRVLLSLDMEKTPLSPEQQGLIHRRDLDFPISYVKSYGKGRVFYCALGHQHDIFWNPVILQHFLDGIQFVLGDLEADTTPSSSAGKPGYRWQKKEEGIALLNRGKTVWQLNYDRGLGRAYFHPVCLTDGTPLTWLRPPDHVWHRSVWFSWKFINGINYWEESPDMGRTEMVEAEDRLNPDSSAQVEMTIQYHPPGKSPVLQERRRLNVHAPDREGRYAIDWHGLFTALQQDLVLDRTPLPGEPGGKSYGGYAGLSIRLAKETRNWRISDSEGRSNMACHGQPARWIRCEFLHTASNREAGIAVLDHPQNLRHPAPSFVVLVEEIPFVFFSPALLFKESYTLVSGASLSLRYRILVYPGRAGRGGLESAWKAYAQASGEIFEGFGVEHGEE